MSPKFFRTFQEFEREYLRPGRVPGMSVEDMLDDNPFERDFLFDRDPFDEDEEEDDDL